MHQIINERVDTMMATIIKMMEKKAGPERMKQIEGGSSKPEDEKLNVRRCKTHGKLSE
jgi:hypothetical protein